MDDVAQLKQELAVIKARLGMLEDMVHGLNRDNEHLSAFRLKVEGGLNALIQENRERIAKDAEFIQVLQWAFGVDDILAVYEREKPRWEKAKQRQEFRPPALYEVEQ